MSRHSITIKSKTFLNHNVIELETTKPDNYDFKPGQATDVALLKEGWEDKKRPFTFTSLPSENHLLFTIKIYPSHNGVTEQLEDLDVGDILLIDQPYGAIKYKGSGIFLAGGAGITPFLSILRKMKDKEETKNNKLFFSNKSEKDIFLQNELSHMLGSNYHNVLTQEKMDAYHHGRIDKDFLKQYVDNLSQYFYLCGPPEMVESLEENLKDLGVDDNLIIIENFDD